MILGLSVRNGEKWMNLRYLLEVVAGGGEREDGRKEVKITCQKKNGGNIVVHIKNMGRLSHSLILTSFEPVTSLFGII